MREFLLDSIYVLTFEPTDNPFAISEILGAGRKLSIGKNDGRILRDNNLESGIG